jgi:hypothetical protein
MNANMGRRSIAKCLLFLPVKPSIPHCSEQRETARHSLMNLSMPMMMASAAIGMSEMIDRGAAM